MVFENVTLPFNKVSTDAVYCVEHSQRKLAIIEIYVILTAILLGILVVFGSCRRRTHTKSLKYLIWTSHVLSTYLISYTIGQMQSAPFRNSFRHSCSLRILQASNPHEVAQIFDMDISCSVYLLDILHHRANAVSTFP
jgi:hypothetical protein